MNMTSVHFKIMHCFRRNIYTISEIAEILNISNFKVKRYVKDLEYMLKESSVVGIHNKLNKNISVIDELKKKQSFTPEERQMYLILKFLKYDTINLRQISEEISITRRTLTNDLNNLKETLEKFKLEIKNLTRYGVTLEGEEKGKREFFELYLIKIFIEHKYLPKVFDNYFVLFKSLKKTYEISKIIEKVFKLTGAIDHSFGILHLEIISYIAVIRKDFKDKSVDFSLENIAKLKECEKLIEVLRKKNIYSSFEISNIIIFCKERNYKVFLSMNQHRVKQVMELISFLEEKLDLKIKIDSNFLERIIFIIIIMEFKRKFNIDEFYIFNNDIGKAYLGPYKKISDLIKKYYGQIDSFDLSNLTMTFLNRVYLEAKEEIKEMDSIVVVYKFLHRSLTKDLCEEVGLEKNYKVISYFSLDEFLLKNNPITILTFEDLDFSGFDIKGKLIEFNFPITKYDKLKLKPLIEKK